MTFSRLSKWSPTERAMLRARPWVWPMAAAHKADYPVSESLDTYFP